MKVQLSGIGCICDPGFDGEFCEVTTTLAPPTTQSNTDDYDFSTTFSTTNEVTENSIDDSTDDTTGDEDSTEEIKNDDEVAECENPNPDVITIGNGTILKAYCDKGSLNGTR